VSIYKRGDVYWYKFQWRGKLLRESSKQGSNKVARQMEAAHRTSLAKGVVGIREKQPAPTVGEFLQRRFLPYAEARHAATPNTLRYYRSGAKLLVKDAIISCVLIDQINDQHARGFAARLGRLSPVGINRGLRTLRRALNLALEWGDIERPARIHLVPGEGKRTRVLTDAETTRYLEACTYPWKVIATIIADEGLRPAEVFALEWPHVLLNSAGGFLTVVAGKTKSAARTLPLTPRVHGLLREHHRAASFPESGWIFPAGSVQGHANRNTTKYHHALALKAAGVQPFVPYVLRHTALTKLAAACKDPFVVMRIAGHSSITMTQRYCHPQADAIGRAFASLNARSLEVGTKVGTPQLKM